MIDYFVAYCRCHDCYEVIRMPIGPGWMGEVIEQFTTAGEATQYVADLKELFGIKE